jgi:hypothetical protein
MTCWHAGILLGPTKQIVCSGQPVPTMAKEIGRFSMGFEGLLLQLQL